MKLKQACIGRSRHVTVQRVKLLVEVTVPRCVTEVMYKMLHPFPGYYGVGREGEITNSTNSSNQETGRGKRKGNVRRRTWRKEERTDKAVEQNQKRRNEEGHVC